MLYWGIIVSVVITFVSLCLTCRIPFRWSGKKIANEDILEKEIRKVSLYLNKLHCEYAEVCKEKYGEKRETQLIPKSFADIYDLRLHVLDKFPKPVWILDPRSFKEVYANEAALKLWSIPTLRDFQERDFSLISSDANKKVILHWVKTFEEDPTKTIQQDWTFYSEGVPIHQHITVSPYYLPSGRLAVWIVVVSPESPTEQSREVLLRSYDSLRHSSSMVSLYTMTGRLIFQNPSAQRRLGLNIRLEDEVSNSRLDPTSFLPYVISRTAVRTIIDNVLSGKNLTRKVKVRIGKEIGYHMLTMYVISDVATGVPSILITEDNITDLINQKKKLRMEELTTTALKKAKTKAEIFLGAMSHEIRTPLHGIIGLTQSVLEEPTLNGEARRLVHNILSSGEHLLTLVNNTLDISKLDAERLQLKISKFNPYTAVEQVIDWLVPMAQEKGLHICTLMPINLPLLKGDASRIGQILLNFLSNALKFTSSGGVEISAHLSTHLVDRAPHTPDLYNYSFTQSFSQTPQTPGSPHHRSATSSHNNKRRSVSLSRPPSPMTNSSRDDESSFEEDFVSTLEDDDEKMQFSDPLDPGIQCHHLTSLGPKYVHFLITDSGIGMKKEDLPKLFERFSQIQSYTIPKHDGTGLGLSISRELALLMGGAIGVRSKLDVGSTFWVSVPYVPAGDRTDEDCHYEFSLSYINVIVFDERPFVMKSFSHYFQQWSIKLHSTEATKDNDQVQAILSSIDASYKPDIVFISHHLMETCPNLLAEARQKFLHHPCKFYLNTAEGYSRNLWENLGFDGIFSIPVYATQLVKILSPYFISQEEVRLDGVLLPGSPRREDILELESNRDMRILLVEDNKINQVVALNFLHSLGYVNVDVHENGLSGLQAYQKNKYDLVLMDILMPEMDGITTTKLIRTHERDNSLRRVPIIALTASHTPEVEQKTKLVGMDDVLSKPFKKKDLLRKLEQHLK